MGKKHWHRETEAEREGLWPLSPEERYISVDIEADGPVPGLHSMLSLGAAAYNAWGQRVGKFSANLETLPDATTDDRTMAWWEGQPEAWKRARERPREPKTVMEEFHLFALGEGPKRSGRPVMVAYPAAVDAMWVGWYLHAFTSEDPFRRRCIDVKTLAMQLIGGGYANAAKRNMPASWLSGQRHSHVAVQDAIEQGELFVNIVEALREERRARSGDHGRGGQRDDDGPDEERQLLDHALAMDDPKLELERRVQLARMSVIHWATLLAERPAAPEWKDDGTDYHNAARELPDPWGRACLWALHEVGREIEKHTGRRRQ